MRVTSRLEISSRQPFLGVSDVRLRRPPESRCVQTALNLKAERTSATGLERGLAERPLLLLSRAPFTSRNRLKYGQLHPKNSDRHQVIGEYSANAGRGQFDTETN